MLIKLMGLIQSKHVRYLLVGTSSFVFEFSLFYVLEKQFGIGYLTANIVAFLIANIYVYLLSRLWVFGKGVHSTTAELMYFGTSLMVGLLISQLVLWVLVSQIEMETIYSKILSIVAVVLWNYHTRNKVVFKKQSVKKV